MRSRSIAPFAAALLLFVGGAAVFCYPAVSSMLAERNQARVVQTYEQTVQAESEADLDAQWALAEEYNENLAGDPVHDPFVPGSGYALPDNYLEVLNLDGVMGRLTIPKIDLDLPIYHGTDEATLQKGVGHIESTSLPIGGEYRHAVLTGHRGLPSAELFTRLDELDIGDEFYIHVLDKTLAYQVDRILTVEPDELESLVAEPGRDYVTLVTCTPYGVNTHRLLVRGSRVPYTPGQEQAAAALGVGGVHGEYGLRAAGGECGRVVGEITAIAADKNGLHRIILSAGFSACVRSILRRIGGPRQTVPHAADSGRISVHAV